MNISTRRLAAAGMLCAVAFIATACIHLKLVPGAPFLTYDPKDVIIVIGGFIYGPLYSLVISAVVSFIEMVTISDSGIIGLIMQMIASGAYAIPAALYYKHNRTRRNAALGLILGSVCMTVMMLLWNWLITPLYLGTDREVVVKLLVPAILPFNILKVVINTLLTLIIYKPLVNALRKAGLIEER